MPELGTTLIPDPNFAGRSEFLYRCDYQLVGDVLEICDVEPDVTAPEETVALVGDSHAHQLRPALAVVVKKLNWRILDLSNPNCLYSEAVRKVSEPSHTECIVWYREVTDWLNTHPEINYLISSNRAGSEVEVAGEEDWFTASVEGYLGAWRKLCRKPIGHARARCPS